MWLFLLGKSLVLASEVCSEFWLVLAQEWSLSLQDFIYTIFAIALEQVRACSVTLLVLAVSRNFEDLRLRQNRATQVCVNSVEISTKLFQTKTFASKMSDFFQAIRFQGYRVELAQEVVVPV